MRRAWNEWKFHHAEGLRGIGYAFLAVLTALVIVAAGYTMVHH